MYFKIFVLLPFRLLICRFLICNIHTYINVAEFVMKHLTYKLIVNVTHPLYESRMWWIPDPRDSVRKSVQPPDINVTVSDSVRPRDISKTVSETSETKASAIAASVLSGAPLTPSLPKKCRRRRRRIGRQNFEWQ